jgi:hypothetical protein
MQASDADTSSVHDERERFTVANVAHAAPTYTSVDNHAHCSVGLKRRRPMATHLPRILLITLTAIFIWPSLAAAERPAVLVNPHVQGNRTAKGIDIVKTIQEGIDMVDPGGKVMVLPGTYAEAVTIEKGLTLEAVGGESGPVIVAPPETPEVAILVETPDPVVIRGLTVQYTHTGVTGGAGIRGQGLVDLTIEETIVMAVNPPIAMSSLIVARTNDARMVLGKRARLVVRHSLLDGKITDRPAPFPQIFGITVGSDIDAVLEENVIRRTGGACILVLTRPDLGGETNADIVGNDLDECHPLGRIAAIIAGPPAPLPPGTVTATGTVNIMGNTIRNSSRSCLPTNAIHYEFFTGRIEGNRILKVVQECAMPNSRTRPAAIWVGAIRPFLGPAAAPVVRFNDIEGNAHAGLRVGPNIDTPLDARCNWWGSGSGPSVGTDPPGSDIVLEAGAPTPDFTPWATAPIAETDETTCTGEN